MNTGPKIAFLVILACAVVGTMGYGLVALRQEVLTNRMLMQKTTANIYGLHLPAGQQAKVLASMSVSAHNHTAFSMDFFRSSAAPVSGPVNCAQTLADYNTQSDACLQKLQDHAILGNSSSACAAADTDVATLAASCNINLQ